MTSDASSYVHERYSFVIVDIDLPDHAVQAAAAQKAAKLVADDERVRTAELIGSEPYGDSVLQLVQHFSYWVEMAP